MNGDEKICLVDSYRVANGWKGLMMTSKEKEHRKYSMDERFETVLLPHKCQLYKYRNTFLIN